MAADIVLKNADVITMDARRPYAGIVAVTGDRISLVGGADSLEQATGAGTGIIDCGGRTVVPGFNDAHCHIFSFIRKLLSIDLSPASVKSIDDIKLAVRRKADSSPPGQWLSGTDFNDFYLAEKRYPDRHDLDDVAPRNPVVLSHRSLHACVLNSLALSLAGITRETPEPGEGWFQREIPSGEPNGILFNMLGYIREKVMPPISEEDMLQGLALADRAYSSFGITSLQDATFKNDYDRWLALRRFKESERLKARVGMMPGVEAWQQFFEAGLCTGSGDIHLRLGPVKMMLGEAGGILQPSPPELERRVIDCHLAGFQLAFHAVEESTVAAAIGSLEKADRRSPVPGRRHRIEHCAECPPHLLERLKAIEAVIVTQPPFLYYSGERYLATVAPDLLPWLYRIRSPLERGVTVAASSDSPVVPCSPLVGMYAAVTRRAESGQVLLPEEAISASEALAMYTVNAAYASFEEDIKGTITPGKLADMVVLSDNPLKVPPEKIKDIRVEMTIIGGRVVGKK